MKNKPAYLPWNKNGKLPRFTELSIAMTLRVGVLVSFSLIVTGIILFYLHDAGFLYSAADLKRLINPGAGFPYRLNDIWSGLLMFNGLAYIASGLLLLLLTPAVRVFLFILYFLFYRDRTYVLITFIVFFLLLTGWILGRL